MPYKDIKYVSEYWNQETESGTISFRHEELPDYKHQGFRRLIAFLNCHAGNDDALFRENLINYLNDGRHWVKKGKTATD